MHGTPLRWRTVTGIRAGSSEMLDAARTYTTPCGLLKQPDKQEMPNWSWQIDPTSRGLPPKMKGSQHTRRADIVGGLRASNGSKWVSAPKPQLIEPRSNACSNRCRLSNSLMHSCGHLPKVIGDGGSGVLPYARKVEFRQVERRKCELRRNNSLVLRAECIPDSTYPASR